MCAKMTPWSAGQVVDLTVPAFTGRGGPQPPPRTPPPSPGLVRQRPTEPRAGSRARDRGAADSDRRAHGAEAVVCRSLSRVPCAGSRAPEAVRRKPCTGSRAPEVVRRQRAPEAVRRQPCAGSRAPEAEAGIRAPAAVCRKACTGRRALEGVRRKPCIGRRLGVY